MAKPIATIPTFKVILEMSGYDSLTSWMARKMPREQVAALSKEARRERKRAQIRVCKLKARRAKVVSNLDANTATPRCHLPTAGHHPLRDVWGGLLRHPLSARQFRTSVNCQLST
jgi:hypothetical protein